VLVISYSAPTCDTDGDCAPAPKADMSTTRSGRTIETRSCAQTATLRAVLVMSAMGGLGRRPLVVQQTFDRGGDEQG
jgi:hypothetical protein